MCISPAKPPGPIGSEKHISGEKYVEEKITSRFNAIYDFDEVYTRHHQAVSKRDTAYQELYSRRGKSYLVSFKPIRNQAFSPNPAASTAKIAKWKII